MTQTPSPTLHKGLQGDFVPAVYPGHNPSRLRVLGKNLLVRVDTYSPVTGGGIHITDDRVEKMTEAGETGVLFDVGPEAFRLFDDGSRWQGRRPEVGQRIAFERYAGTLQKGMDGHVYRIMDYRAVACVIDVDTEADEGAAA